MSIAGCVCEPRREALTYLLLLIQVDRGRLYPFKGNYTEWLEHKRRRLDMEKVKEAAQAKALQNELEWIRQRSSQATKARIKA